MIFETGATFKITDTNLQVPSVTLSTQDNNKLLEQLKRRFKRKIKQNKYRSKMTNQVKLTIKVIKLIQHLAKRIDYLCCHLKMKMIEHLLVNILHLLL